MKTRCYYAENVVYLKVAYQEVSNKGTLQRENLSNLLFAMKSTRKWIVVRIDGKIAGVSTDYRVLAKVTKHLAKCSDAPEKMGGSPIIYKEVSAIAVGIDEVWKLREEIQWEDLLLFGTDFQKRVWRKLWELTHAAECPKAEADPEAEADQKTEADPEAKANPQTKADPEAKADQKTEANTNESGTEDIGKPEVTEGEGAKKATETVTKAKGAVKLCSYSDFAELCDNRAGVRAVAHAIGLNPVSVLIPCHLVVPKESIDRIREIQRKAESTIFKGEDLCLNSILADSTIDFGEYSLGKELKRDLIVMELA